MTNDLTKSAVAVVECESAFEGLRFPSGDLLTIQKSKPRRVFAVIRRMGEEIDVMSLHDDRPSAIRHADEIVALIKEGRQEEAEGRGTLQ